jgi:DNA-binding LytR/AlgR family response regulator
MGLFLAAFAAFDSHPGEPWANFVYWQGAMLGGGVIAALVEVPVHRRLANRPRLFAVAQALAMTPPITVWIWIWANLFHSGPWRIQTILASASSVFVVNAAVVVLAWLLRAALARREEKARAPEAAPETIRAKLPPRLARARLIAIEAEDHYLRVHTEAGSDLILMRFGDAISALSSHDGMQVHRSWWVARRSVESVLWKKGRGTLTLEGGISTPVSATFARTVRVMDWA